MLDIRLDFVSIADNLKMVTVDSSDVANVLRRAVTTKEAAASGGKYTTSDTVFHVASAELSAPPKLGTVIADDDGEWTVVSVAWQTFTQRWRCIATQLAIESGLTVTIQSVTFAKGATGALEPTWSTLAADVPAKIQIESTEAGVENQNRTETTTATVYFASDPNLAPSYRIIASDGMVLKVLRWEGFNELDRLFQATCEVSKWPQA